MALFPTTAASERSSVKNRLTGSRRRGSVSKRGPEGPGEGPEGPGVSKRRSRAGFGN